MTTRSPWIERAFVDQIVTAGYKKDHSVDVFLLLSPGGMGKTYAGRDAGHRLGSVNGYEPYVGAEWAWSGLLDLYDPDTNSNQGLERRLSQVFDPNGLDFEDYRLERRHYDLYFKGGIQGEDLEKQRRKVEEAFAAGLRRAAEKRRLVIALDTIERIEAGTDPVQQRMGLTGDTASIAGWLVYQIIHVPNCVWLLLGRRGEQFVHTLRQAVAELAADGPVQVNVHTIPVDRLDEDEIARLYAHRIQDYPTLGVILDDELRNLLVQCTEGNPLLLDLALQALLETQDPVALRRALGQGKSIEAAGRALVQSYVESLDPDRELLLRYLAMARNGLEPELLEFLEPDQAKAKELKGKLQKMAVLPFIKERRIATPTSDGAGIEDRPTYFLHDEMYRICDTVLFSTPREVRHFSQRLVGWYERQRAALASARDTELLDVQQRRRMDQDLVVQSLVYRLRADLSAGYAWYLQQENEAIRSAQTGLDMRLRDAFAVFLENAGPEEEPGAPVYHLSSPIDRAIVAQAMPSLFDDFLLDSAALWILRYTIRGKYDEALKVGAAVRPEIEALYGRNREHYLLAYADFSLWHAQVMMYRGEIDRALALYRETIALLKQKYDEKTLAEQAGGGLVFPEFWRVCLVLGRLHNNVGYTYWMYKGRFRQAIAEFRRAIALFRDRLPEELANSQDNLGRVYARLGDEFAAIQLIKEGWLTRKNLGHTYREALSLISWAMSLARLGHPEPALKKAHVALAQVRQTDVMRGRGLVLYARGLVYRILAESWREESIPVEDAIEYARLAEIDLRDAVEIFTQIVKEPIREVRALNELACLYRARYLILTVNARPESEREKAFLDGVRTFRDAIRRAQECGYEIEELDSMQDLAVLYARAGHHQEVENYLSEVVRRIPQEYQITSGKGLVKLSSEDQIDLYYKLLGQVELLRGALAFQGGLRGRWEESARVVEDETLLRAARHYFLAVAYFNRYSTEYARQQTNVRIHERFRVCTSAQVCLLRNKFAEWTKEYCLDPELLRSLTEVVFGLFG